MARSTGKRIRIAIICGLAAGVFCAAASAQDKAEWPCFHGPSRTNKSTETGLMKKWPEPAPELLWTVSGLGKGYTSVSIAEGYLYTAGALENKTYVFAFDLDGKQIWKKLNDESWEANRAHARSYAGSRSTPTFDDGLVYHVGDLGRLAAFDHETGEEKWIIQLRQHFDAEYPKYGYTESIHIESDRLYCSPAGKKGFLVCLNKKDGKLIWANTDIPGTLGFSSPIIVEHAGYRQIINLSSSCVYGADTKTGKLLWTVPFKNKRSNNCTDAIFHDGHVFASTGYGKGSILIQLTASGDKVVARTVWKTDLMDNHHGGVILHEGHLYGAGHNARGWFCLDFKTGRQKWNAPGKGSLFYADNMFYCLDEKGTMKLVKATPEKYDEVSSFTVPDGGPGLRWAHPVVCGGRLYVRHADNLYAYRIKGGE